jgi:phosphate starvation-inducible protein PhoH
MWQIDLARGQKSGLIKADRILHGVRGGCALHQRRRRPPSLVQKIVNAYERDAAARNAGSAGTHR